MSRLDELIAELCPDGVEYYLLGDITSEINIGINPRKFFKLNPDNPEGYYVTVRELNGLQGVKEYEKTDKINLDAVRIINERAHIDVGDILFSNTGTVGKLALVIEAPYNWGVNEGIYVIKPNNYLIDSRFLFYYLDSGNAYKDYSSKFTGSTLKHVTQKALAQIKVPVPPLEVQHEIVRVLDNFTFLSAELSAELSEELSARRKQYEYYLDYLLLNAKQTESVKLKDISKFYNGDRGKNYPKVSEMVPEGIPFVNAGDVNGRVDYLGCNKITQEKYDSMGGAKLLPGDILYCLRGSTGKNGIYERTGGTVASSLVAIRATGRVHYKYLYYLLNSSMEKKQRIRSDTGAAQPNLSAQNVGEFEFPLPSLAEQKHIISILDRFEGISLDINVGLPAEIEARQKQYEYYRDKLLTFKEKVS